MTKTGWKRAAARGLRMLRLGLALLLGAGAAGAMADDAASLRAKYGDLREALRNNNFQRPLHIDSGQSADALRGDVYAVLEHPFAEFSSALKDPADWCDILILPFNTKYCHAVEGNGRSTLQVRIGRKFDQPAQDAYRLDFSLRQIASSPDYFESRLDAKSGPLGTRDYRILLSAVPLDAGRTFMHLSYSYGYGAAGRFAMQMYLSTVGAEKVGFTITGRDGSGPARLHERRARCDRAQRDALLPGHRRLHGFAARPARAAAGQADPDLVHRNRALPEAVA